MSITPPTGPPTGPVSGPPGFGATPMLQPEPPSRRSPWPIVAGVALGVALVLGGVGLGFVLFGGDDGEPEAAAAPTTVVEEPETSTEDPFGGDLSDFSDLFEGDLGDLLPNGFEDDPGVELVRVLGADACDRSL